MAMGEAYGSRQVPWQRVPSEEIEETVGRERHPRAHYARADSESQVISIMHSYECLEDRPDLDCEYSEALHRGLAMDRWEDHQDRPVLVRVEDGRLVPVPHAVEDDE